MPEPAVRIDNVGFAYHADAWILRSCTAILFPGSVTALLGPNGCGKTTLLKLLLRIRAPSEGEIQVRGRIAFVPQLFRTAFAYTVLDMVVMGRAREIGLWSQPSRQDEAAALAALERLGLADLAASPFDEISGGQRQLAILARAIVANADVILLDEPCAALDLRNQPLVLDRIGTLADEGLTILFSTHAPQHAVALADQVMLMHGAAEHVIGPIDEVLTERSLERLYGVPVLRVARNDSENRVEGYLPLLPRREKRVLP